MKIPEFRPLACAKAREGDEAWASDEYLAEEKFDGSRYLFIKDEDGPRFCSRHISKDTGKLVVKTDRVPHLVKELAFLPSGTVLDGEIYKRGKKSNYITHIMGSLPERALDLQREKGYLDYAVFDMPFYAGKDLRNKPLIRRRKMLTEALAQGLREHVKRARFTITNKENFYRKIVEEELGEGVILKHLQSSYDTLATMAREKRSVYWRKAKKFDTYDCVIVGFTRPEKFTVNVKGEQTVNSNYTKKWVSGVIVAQYVEKSQYDLEFAKELIKPYPYPNRTYNEMIEFCNQQKLVKDGKVYYLQPFTVTVGMNYEVRRLLSRYKSTYIGKVAEIGAQERTDTGSFRHPRFIRFREDKEPSWCVFRKDES